MAKIEHETSRMTALFVDHPKSVVALILVVTLFFGWFAKDIERDHSTESMLPADDPIITYYEEFREHFNIHAKIAIGVESEDGVYTPEVLAQVDRITKFLEKQEWAEEIWSLTDIENITAEGGDIVTGPLIDGLPKTVEEAREVRRAVLANPMIAKALVSADEKSTIVIVQPSFMAFETDLCVAGYDQIKAFLAQDPGPAKTYLAGFPMVIGLTDRYMDRDNNLMLPLIVVVIVLLLFISFRSIRGVWIPLAVVVAAAVWTFGTMHLIGWKINIISTSIPIILMAMGVADGIHVIHEYYHHLRKGVENRTAVLLTMKEMNAPVIMTSVTTSAGFLALATSRIVPIREYGMAVAFGVMVAMVFSLSFIPAALVLLGQPKKVLSEQVAEAGLLDRFSRGLGRFSLAHMRLVIVLFVIGLGVTGALSSQIRASNNPVEYFKTDSEIRVADEFLNKNFAGTGAVFVQVYGDEEGALKDPILLQKIRKLQDELEELDAVGNTQSIADYVTRMHYVLNEENPEYDRVPGTPEDLGPGAEPNQGRELVAQYLLLYELSGGSALSHLVDYTYQRATIDVNVKSNDSLVYKKIMDRLEKAKNEIFEPGVVGETGTGVANLKIVEYLVVGQVYSLAVSFVVVFVMLVFLFRSLVFALIGSIPLVITVATNFAIMVASGIPLNMGTALIASVSIGIGVDYSIHFINRYRLESGRTQGIAETVNATMTTSGRAIFLNAASVGGGFAVLLFSSFLPIVYLGLLMPLIMGVNALAALLVIPAFLNLIHGKRQSAQGGI